MRVLVTRPEPAAAATAERLRRMGLEPAVLPLTETRPLQPVLPVGRHHAVAVTSANALRHCPRAMLDALTALPCYTVGARTAAAAGEAGFPEAIEADGDVAALAARLAAALPAGARVLYLAGRVRTGDLAGLLSPYGMETDVLETYDTVETLPAAAEVAAAAGGAPFAAVLVHSRRAAELLARLACDEATRRWFAGTRFVAISPRAAAPLAVIRSARVEIAGHPDEKSLLARLRRRDA